MTIEPEVVKPFSGLPSARMPAPFLAAHGLTQCVVDVAVECLSPETSRRETEIVAVPGAFHSTESCWSNETDRAREKDNVHAGSGQAVWRKSTEHLSPRCEVRGCQVI